jgi:uncharacterized membrane protein YgdD (TMEM256/DUF423 family)
VESRPQGRLFVVLGSVFGFLGVTLGAFGRHALETKLTERALAQWQTASQYQLVHAVVLIAVGIWLINGGPKLLEKAGAFLTGGIVIFAGSLYALALTGVKVLGAITPIGGAGFLIGWALIGLAGYRSK